MNRVVAFSLKQRVAVMIMMAFLFVAGIFSFIKLNIEAYPDPVPPLVDIITQSSGQSAEEIERYITIPLEVQLAGIPHVTTVGAPNPNGNGVVQIPLTDVASVKLVSGASFIYREKQERYIPIKFSVRGRDLGGAVMEAQRKVAEQVKIPSGYRMEWVGEFGQMNEAMTRLKIVVPLSLGLILLLLFFNFSSITDTLLAASVMPMALIGGIFALYLTGTPFSVSAAIGFIGLFGISVMEGIIVLTYFNQTIETGVERSQAIRNSCQTRLRPVMMTCCAACVGLLPAAFATGIGSQVQKPLALVVVGGILLAPVLVLIILPLLIDLFSKRESLLKNEEAATTAEL